MLAFDKALLDVIDDLDELSGSREDAWQIPREEGMLLFQIALAAQARTIVEVGTSYGFSGLFWAAALRQTSGRLHTIEKDLRKVNAAKTNFERAGVAERITTYYGEAKTVLPQISGAIDIVFIDADKPACRFYFDSLWPKVRVGGSIITDNAATHREELEGFVEYVRTRPDASSTEVAVGNGIEWTVKVGK
jgi:predicted O-methyltransferase YrrM